MRQQRRRTNQSSEYRHPTIREWAALWYRLLFGCQAGCSLHHSKLLAQELFVELKGILPSESILAGNIYCARPPVPLNHSEAVRFAVFAQKSAFERQGRTAHNHNFFAIIKLQVTQSFTNG